MNTKTEKFLRAEEEAAHAPDARHKALPHFAIRNLSVLAYANGFTLWHYKSTKATVEDVRSVNYFADAADMLTYGDMVMVTAPDGGQVLMVTLADTDNVRTQPLS